MQAVFAAERALGREPRDVSAAKVGYDIESLDPTTGHLHFLEVKGRVEGGDTITVTTNEMLVALNAKNASFWRSSLLPQAGSRTSLSTCESHSTARLRRTPALRSSISTNS